MKLTPKQVQSSKQLERWDTSKITEKPITTDEYLFEISEKKARLMTQLTDAIKQSSFDCELYSGDKCMQFGNPSIHQFSYVPNYKDQEDDTTVRANLRTVKEKWVGQEITIKGKRYFGRSKGKGRYDLYEPTAAKAFMEERTNLVPSKIAELTVRKDANGKTEYTIENVV
jgi:hypothetical protein